MLLLRRFIPFFVSAALFGALEATLFSSHLFWYLLPLIGFLVVFPAGHLHSWRIGDATMWRFLLPPLSLAVSGFLLSVFLSGTAIIHALFFLIAILLFWYHENLLLLILFPIRYQPYALENISRYLNLFSVFFFFSALFAARIFLALPYSALVASAVAVSVILVIQTLLTAKVSIRQHWGLALGFTVIMVELFAVAVILPTTYFVSALLLTIPYYVMTNIARHAFANSLTQQVIRRYAIVGLLTLVMTMLTAPWS